MAIYSLEEASQLTIAREIEPFEESINDYLSLPATVSFLQDPAQAVHFVHRIFKNAAITDVGVAALKEAIEAAGWKSVLVELRQFDLYVSFYVEEQAAPEPETPEEPETPTDSEDEPNPSTGE